MKLHTVTLALICKKVFCQIYSETPAMDSFFCKCCRSWVWRNFSEHLFCKTSVSNYLCLSAIRLKGESQNGCFRNKARQIFRKTNISYTLVCTRKCAYQGVRNVYFSENLACFVFLKHPFWDSPICLIIDVLGSHPYAYCHA